MGGLALGAWIASLFIHKIKNALLCYAIIEGVIGIYAFFFHDIFILFDNFIFIENQIGSPLLFSLTKWGLAALLILPQSILLGSTFPLISSGILQLSPINPGRKFSLLYFNNSIGAAIGALVSGFILIEMYGLPGTVAIAGSINLFVAASVYFLIHKTAISQIRNNLHAAQIIKDRLYILLIGVAFFTGMASFFYEIAWIRMLTLVLGATTHAFELMLSAFILGLALGSLWIKRRIDTLVNPIRTIGYIQLLMALAAMITLIFYNNLFDLIVVIFKKIERTEQGYTLFMLYNHAIALVVMLPATFFAGMTLPLITNILYKKENNDRVIGHVYTSNTLGAIIGIVLAINIVMPETGTKGVISVGAIIDIIIGISLLTYIYLKKEKTKLIYISLFAVSIFEIIYLSSNFDLLKTSSGVFRYGKYNTPPGTQVVFHKDGKSSTVDVRRYQNGEVSLATNGKTDASISVYGGIHTTDEVTMVMMAALPLALKPDIKTVANIGMGSGQTVNTLLAYEKIQKVDTIEIEKSIIDALKEFKIYSYRTRYDKRSHIYIDDAKSFFSTTRNKYDLIISEPSNPWVSGVANLFTTEFYKRIKNNLEPKGMFLQWVQLYEFNMESLASVFKSISENFSHYTVYNSDDSNLFIIASDAPINKKTNPNVFKNKKAQSILNRIGIRSATDLDSRFLGDKLIYSTLLQNYKTKKTTDFYPQLPYIAAKSLFLKENANKITELHYYPLPIINILSNRGLIQAEKVTSDIYFTKSRNTYAAIQLYNDFIHNKPFNDDFYSADFKKELMSFKNEMTFCNKDKVNEKIIFNTSLNLLSHTYPYIGKNKSQEIFKSIIESPCYNFYSIKTKSWLSLHAYNISGDYNNSSQLAQTMLTHYSDSLSEQQIEYVIASGLLAAIQLKRKDLAEEFRKYVYLKSSSNKNLNSLAIKLLIAQVNII